MRFPLLALLTALPLFAASNGAPTPSASTSATTAEAKKTAWHLSVSAAAEDGSRSILATLPADAPIPSGFSQVTPTLVLRYRSGRTVAYVVFDTFLGDDAVDAVVTLGAEPPIKQTWPVSSDGRSAFVPGDALLFIRHLEKVTSFSVRVTPAKRDPITVSFTPRQTDLVIKALLSAGVKYGG